MRSGMEIGREENIQISVTEDMFASFEGKIVHPVYSTVTMTYHMEWVSRKIILPFLEDHEEGMGASVKLSHIAPSPLGTVVTLTATLVEVQDNVVLTKIVASNQLGIIGKGEVKQVILPKKIIAEKLKIASIFPEKEESILD
ncbi:thioesterase family protein [Psychrobacillus lasiicapitis]|uniref:Thioesterase n=1 Tax=Psychrobacillus lasiicapitis TaxID=1636719 RepID=A0A544SWP1_9BACI|nr:thioesterase [Psychrobacillus lasiicapitis]TQR09551.1 thioesterase [Psychrobacillus lasiicapitis]GGA29520.1 thioesterase [Psychrobacillus lasiicapitis]